MIMESRCQDPEDSLKNLCGKLQGAEGIPDILVGWRGTFCSLRILDGKALYFQFPSISQPYFYPFGEYLL